MFIAICTASYISYYNNYSIHYNNYFTCNNIFTDHRGFWGEALSSREEIRDGQLIPYTSY